MEINNQTMPKQPNAPAKSRFREHCESLIWAVLLFLVIRTCLVQSYKIPSGSMEDTLLVGDCLLVNKFIYGIKVPYTELSLPQWRPPKRGDVVVFRYPEDRTKDFIKRVVGEPNDRIEIRAKRVFVNGGLYRITPELHKDAQILPGGQTTRDNFGPIKVPKDSYFVMGDNRDNSYDSRFWGCVRKRDIVGQAFVKYWSWDNGHLMPRLSRIGRIIE